jgi:NAD(P)-dependent dehydrogenase (short-subunit alcohol dehydrogenase family)
LDGKILLVTGAGSGLGRAAALSGAEAGAAGLMLADRNEQALAEVAGQLAARGVATRLVVADLTAHSAPDELVASAVDAFGRLDAAINSAGVLGESAEVADCADDVLDLVLAVNFRAVFRCMRAELRQMYAQGSGAVVNVSSASVYGMHTKLAPYIASKAAVVAASRVAAKEAGRHGVRVNAICPGITATPMSEQSAAARPETAQLAEQIPLGRPGAPGEIADAMLWLCSDRSSFTNGAALVVDGGRSG